MSAVGQMCDPAGMTAVEEMAQAMQARLLLSEASGETPPGVLVLTGWGEPVTVDAYPFPGGLLRCSCGLPGEGYAGPALHVTSSAITPCHVAAREGCAYVLRDADDVTNLRALLKRMSDFEDLTDDWDGEWSDWDAALHNRAEALYEVLVEEPDPSQDTAVGQLRGGRPLGEVLEDDRLWR